MMKKLCYKTHCFTKVAHMLGPILKSENPKQKLLMSKCVIMVCTGMHRSGLLNGRGTGPSGRTSCTFTVSFFYSEKTKCKTVPTRCDFLSGDSPSSYPKHNLHSSFQNIYKSLSALSKTLHGFAGHREDRGLISFTQKNTTSSILCMRQRSNGYC